LAEATPASDFEALDEYFMFCKEQKISPNIATAAAFARSRRAATYSMGM
jgi:hypothetical protein